MVKNIFTLLFLISSLVVSSQCLQDEKAKVFQLKAAKTPKIELKKKSAFIQMAKYYEYVCECNKGTNREEELIMLINRIVDVNKNYQFEKYGDLKKVFKCKTLKNNRPLKY